MDLSLLEDVGLSPREARVYEALLKLGLTTVGPIVKQSEVPSSKIYETLDRLARKGFVSSIIKDGRKHFQASPPEQILAVIDERRKRLSDEVIPQLKLLQVGRYGATVYEGVRGLKAIFELTLRETKKGDEILVMGAPLRAQELLDSFLKQWSPRRVKLGIRQRILYQREAEQYGKIRAKTSLTEVGYLSEALAPSWVNIFADFVVIFDLSQETPIAFLIESKGIADNFRNYFEKIWLTRKS